MISPRRAALLGLDAPLSPIMAAVLGLWPADDEEPEYIIPAATGAGANFASTSPARPVSRQPVMELVGQEMSLAQQAEERDLRETLEMITALFALEEVF